MKVRSPRPAWQHGPARCRPKRRLSAWPCSECDGIQCSAEHWAPCKLECSPVPYPCGACGATAAPAMLLHIKAVGTPDCHYYVSVDVWNALHCDVLHHSPFSATALGMGAHSGMRTVARELSYSLLRTTCRPDADIRTLCLLAADAKIPLMLDAPPCLFTITGRQVTKCSRLGTGTQTKMRGGFWVGKRMKDCLFGGSLMAHAHGKWDRKLHWCGKGIAPHRRCASEFSVHAAQEAWRKRW